MVDNGLFRLNHLLIKPFMRPFFVDSLSDVTGLEAPGLVTLSESDASSSIPCWLCGGLFVGVPVNKVVNPRANS